MGNYVALQTPLQNKTITRFGCQQMKGATCSMQGYRHDQEDRHKTIMSMPKHPKCSFFAVYDGHCGDAASNFCASVIHERINDLSNFDEQSIRNTILKADKEFLSDKTRANGGSTLVSCIVTHINSDNNAPVAKVQAINVGDSRALLVRQRGTFKSLTLDHKPDCPDERRRINKAGGHVMNSRVDGQLAVSRAFGDGPYKDRSDLSQSEQKVTSVADITYNHAKTGDFLLIACDGVFEELESKQVAGIALKKLQETNDPAKTLCHLFSEALKSGSKDNMTGVLIHFVDGTDYDCDAPQFIPGSFGTIISEGAKDTESTFFNKYFAECRRAGFEDGPLLHRMAYEHELALSTDPIYALKREELEKEIRRLDISDVSVSQFRHLVNAQTVTIIFTDEHIKCLNSQNINTVANLRKLISSNDQTWDPEALFSEELKNAVQHNLRGDIKEISENKSSTEENDQCDARTSQDSVTSTPQINFDSKQDDVDKDNTGIELRDLPICGDCLMTPCLCTLCFGSAFWAFSRRTKFDELPWDNFHPTLSDPRILAFSRKDFQLTRVESLLDSYEFFARWLNCPEIETDLDF